MVSEQARQIVGDNEGTGLFFQHGLVLGDRAIIVPLGFEERSKRKLQSEIARLLLQALFDDAQRIVRLALLAIKLAEGKVARGVGGLFLDRRPEELLSLLRGFLASCTEPISTSASAFDGLSVSTERMKASAWLVWPDCT